MKTDPVCGMDVSEESEHYTEYAGKTHYFCSGRCLRKFLASPNQYLLEETGDKAKGGCGCSEKKAESPESATESHGCCGGAHHDHPAASVSNKAVDESAIYTCPMHPEIEQQGPGRCPTCGMTLELRTS